MAGSSGGRHGHANCCWEEDVGRSSRAGDQWIRRVARRSSTRSGGGGIARSARAGQATAEV
eukprot:14865459-Alexandrium_andersonii.AAC.1